MIESSNFNSSTEVELAAGWSDVALEELIEDAIGGAWGDDPANAGIDQVVTRVIRGTEFRNWEKERGKTAATRAVDRKSFVRRAIAPGDMIVEISGGGPCQPVGRTLVVDEDALEALSGKAISANFCRRVRFKPYVNPWFIDLALKLKYSLGDLDRFQTETTNIRNLNFPDFISHTRIALPEKEIQDRLVAQVEALREIVNKSQDRLTTIPALLKKFRQSVLAAACSGDLTADWRVEQSERQSGSDLLTELIERRGALIGAKSRLPVDPDLGSEFDIPQGWVCASIDSLSTKVADGVHKTPTYLSTGIPFVTVRNLTAGAGISFERLNYISVADHQQFTARTKPERGDILISKDGTIGTVRVIDTDREFSIFVSVALVKVTDKRITPYLELALNCPAVQERMTRTGTGLQHLVLRDLRQLPIPLPPLSEQVEIVRRVQLLLDLADSIESRLGEATAQVERTTQAILAMAFRGEL